MDHNLIKPFLKESPLPTKMYVDGMVDYFKRHAIQATEQELMAFRIMSSNVLMSAWQLEAEKTKLMKENEELKKQLNVKSKRVVGSDDLVNNGNLDKTAIQHPNEVAILRKKIHKLETEAEESRKASEDMEVRYDNLRYDIHEISLGSTFYKNESERLDKQLKETKNMLSKAKDDLSTRNYEYNQINRRNRETCNYEARFHAQCSRVYRLMNEANKKEDLYNSRFAILQNVHYNSCREITDLQFSMADLKNVVSQIKEELDETNSKLSKTKRKLSRAYEDLDRSKKELAREGQSATVSNSKRANDRAKPLNRQ